MFCLLMLFNFRLEPERYADYHFCKVCLGAVCLHAGTYFQVAESGEGVENANTFVVRLFYLFGIYSHVAVEIEAQGHVEREVMIIDFMLGSDAYGPR